MVLYLVVIGSKLDGGFMRKWILFLGSIVFFTASAQDYQTDPLTLEGQSGLLTVRIVVGEKTAKVYLTGKETAKLDFGKDAKLLQLTAFQRDGVEEELQFSPDQGYYTVKKLPEWEGPYMFRVKTEVKGKKQDVEIQRK